MKTHDELSVLIIEDQKMFRDLAFQVFEDCRRIGADNAEDGFRKFKEECPDITLLDIGLPDKSGLDLLPELLGYDPEAFIVMLTASRISVDVDKAKKLGAAGYIIKPFTYKKVEFCIEKYYDYRKKLSELSSHERAGHILDSLRVESVNADLEHIEEENKKKEQQKKIDQEIKKWRLLFVDDHVINRDRAGKKLLNLGCSVDTASSGEEAIEKFTANNYDFIFMDSQMVGGMNGYEAAEAIRNVEQEKNNPYPTAIIAMIEYSDEMTEHIWQDHGMDNFIKKPARFSDLQEMIEKYIAIRLEKNNAAI